MVVSARVGQWLHMLLWPALFVYLRFGARTRVLIRAGDDVLLVKTWLSDGKWGLPGGGLHWHESPAAGALREVREETGVLLEPTELRLLASEWRHRHGQKFYCHFFAISVPDRAVLVPQRGEITATKWMPVDALTSNQVKAEVHRALELLAEQG